MNPEMPKMEKHESHEAGPDVEKKSSAWAQEWLEEARQGYDDETVRDALEDAHIDGETVDALGRMLGVNALPPKYAL